MSHARSLSSREIADLKPIFQGALDYDRIRIHRGSGFNPVAFIAFANGNPAIALGRHIHVRADYYREDYSGDLDAFAAFIAHEATHVWQWAGGRLNPIRYLWQYWTWPRHGYDIADVTADTRFDDLGYDQQAEVVRAYVVSRGQASPYCVVLAQQLPINLTFGAE